MNYETISYDEPHGGAPLKGRLFGHGPGAPRPGVVLIGDVRGISDEACRQAARISDLGYVVLVADMHGDGASFKGREDARPVVQALAAQPALVRSRARAAVDRLAQCDGVNGERIAAVGYCFGGTVCLELARDDAAIEAAVSLHGGLKPLGAPMANSRVRVLSYTGGDDPVIPLSQVDDFRAEVQAAGCPWQIVVHGGANHAFTTQDFPEYYHRDADRMSFAMLRELFDLAFTTA